MEREADRFYRGTGVFRRSVRETTEVGGSRGTALKWVETEAGAKAPSLSFHRRFRPD